MNFKFYITDNRPWYEQIISGIFIALIIVTCSPLLFFILLIMSVFEKFGLLTVFISIIILILILVCCGFKLEYKEMKMINQNFKKISEIFNSDFVIEPIYRITINHKAIHKSLVYVKIIEDFNYYYKGKCVTLDGEPTEPKPVTKSSRTLRFRYWLQCFWYGRM